jgi:D-sedoheptulose 7-phosphate isomerase
MNFSSNFMREVSEIAGILDYELIEKMSEELSNLRKREGRLFLLGVGGSAANASHAVNDFRKLCGIETYSPTDNVSELTARTNDEGWETVFSEWLKTSHLSDKDMLLVLSVGGGNLEKNISTNLIYALDFAIERKATIIGIVGRDGGYVKKIGKYVLVIPTVNKERVTPHSEAFQAVVWHCLVSHPDLQINATKW